MATSTRLSFSELCRQVQDTLPESLRENTWYLVMAAALVACRKPEEIGSLWHHMADSLGPEDKKRVSLRLRDVFMKEWTLVGIPPIVVAIISLAEAEGNLETAQAESTLSEKWQSIDLSPTSPISARGTSRLQEIYQHNLTPIFNTWGSHRLDMEYLEKAIIYGLYLSDLSVLNSVEAQIVTAVSILCGGYRAPSIWHLRGMRRMGLTEEDVEVVRGVSGSVAEWCGVGKEIVEGWPTCKDIPKEDLEG